MVNLVNLNIEMHLVCKKQICFVILGSVNEPQIVNPLHPPNQEQTFCEV